MGVAPGAAQQGGDFGEIKLLAISWHGGHEAVILGIGGVLGLGERPVAAASFPCA